MSVATAPPWRRWEAADRLRVRWLQLARTEHAAALDAGDEQVARHFGSLAAYLERGRWRVPADRQEAYGRAIELYLGGMPGYRIGPELGIPARTVYRWLARAGVLRRRW